MSDNTQYLEDDETIREIVERIRRGMLREMGKNYPALEAGVTFDEGMQLIKARDEKHLAEAALEVVKREAEMATLCYLAVKHRIAMGEDISAFVDERLEWYRNRRKALTQSPKKKGSDDE